MGRPPHNVVVVPLGTALVLGGGLSFFSQRPKVIRDFKSKAVATCLTLCFFYSITTTR